MGENKSRGRRSDSTDERRDSIDSTDTQDTQDTQDKPEEKPLIISPSRNFPAFLFVKADRNGYYAGETVSGIVHLLVNESFPCSGVYLALKAEERAWICEKTTENDLVGETIETHDGK